MPRRLATRAAAALAAVAAAGALAACGTSSAHGNGYQFTYATKLDTVIPAAKRQLAEPVSGQSLTGRGTIGIGSYRGHVVVMNFFASWCPPCRAETPQFVDAYHALHSKGVTFLGVDTTDLRSQGQAFVSLHHVPYPVIYDQQGQVQLKLGNIPGKLPFTVLLDQRGRVAAVYLGTVTQKDLQTAIDKLHGASAGHVG